MTLGALTRCDRLTWTKARLLCRVATAENEEIWLDLAKRLTERALAREVWLRVSPRVRACWGRARLLARQVAARRYRRRRRRR